MRIWLLKIGEPVPVGISAQDRPHRTGYFAQFLADRGEDVVWWTSTFNHVRKMHLFDEDTTVRVNERLEIQLLRGCGYQSNVSLARLRDHRQIARKFTVMAAEQPPPDIIVSAFPTIELSLESVAYGRARGIPVVLDVRDLWPDIFFDVLPPYLRWAGRLAAIPMTRQARTAFRGATSITAMSEALLQWGLNHAGRTRGLHDGVFPLAYERPAIAADAVAAAGDLLRAKGVDAGKRICWFIGTLGRRYDVPTVIEAARRLAHRREVQFVISGDGDHRVPYMEQAKGLDNLVFTGWVDTAQAAYMMSVAAIGLVAINDHRPTLPNKFFEYFSAGLPVASSVLGEGADLIEKEQCGVNYRLQDPESLAAGIFFLLEDDARRRQMGENGRQIFEQRFRAHAVYSKMADLLTTLAAPRKQGLLTEQKPSRDDS